MRKTSFKTKIALVFFAAYLVLSFFYVGLFYHRAVVVQKSELRTKLMQLSDLSTNLFSPAVVKGISPEPGSMRGGAYKEVVEKLRVVRDADPTIDDTYILVDTDKPGVMKFLANADEEGIVECGEEYDASRFPELMKAHKGPTADREIASDRWGWWLSGYAPIKASDGTLAGILGIDISAATIAQMRAFVTRTAVFAFILGAVLSFAVGRIVSFFLARPIVRLIGGINTVSAGDLDHRIELGTGDELENIADHLNKMAGDLKKHIAELTETTAEKERLNRELEIAAELQKAMLPEYKLDIEELDLAGLSLPAKQVGGDYFDYITPGGNNVGFVIADATGKGLPGSIFMTNSKSIFKVVTTEDISPSKVIQKTNDLVVKNVSPSAAMFVTMFYGIYDKGSKIFRYTNAGHNGPLYVDGVTSEVKVLNAHGCPVGILEHQKYGEDEIRLKTGDVIILYTDGVVEAENTGKEMFGLNRLIDLARDVKDLTSDEIAGRIRDAVFAFSDTPVQTDDLTLLVIKVK